MASFEDQLLALLASVFAPLTDALNNGDLFSQLLANVGWTLDPTTSATTLQGIFGPEYAILSALASDDATTLATDLPNLFTTLLNPQTANPAWPAPFSAQGFWTDATGALVFAEDLLAYLICSFLEQNVPVVNGVLRFVGAINAVDVAVQAATVGLPARPAYRQYSIDWSQLGKFTSSPQTLFSNVYEWGPGYNHGKLFNNVAALLGGVTPLAAVTTASSAITGLFYDAGVAPAGLEQLGATPASYSTSGGSGTIDGKIALIGLPVPAAGTRTGSPAGIALFPLVTGGLSASIPLAPNITITLNGDFSTIPVVANIQSGPPLSVTVSAGSSGSTTLDAEARLDAKNNTGWILFGSTDSSYFSLLQAHTRLVANGPITDLTYKIEGGVDHAQLLIDFSDSDSFIQSFFGSQQQEIDLSGVVLWSSKTGFGFNGQTNLAFSIGVHQSLFGIITIDTITIGFNGSGPSIPFAISGGLSIGPLQASVDQIGFQLEFKQTPDHSGTFGDVDLQLNFKPPNGLGADLDVGPVSGGGYISYDDAKKEYAGILAASFGMPMDTIALELIGILDTILPDGSQGYSFLIIVTVNFPPIQLGFGFTLNGVGGLAGINRSMVLSALQTAVHNGTADNILFPVDPIANATDIISTVSAVFPSATGRYTFGPMLELGWGTPQLLDFQLGIIIEVPDPIRLAILGLIELGLPSLEEPDPDALIVDINVDVVGTIDFDQQLLVILATIYDSRIIEFTLAGDMYLQLAWGGNTQFVVSLGGFNPHFQPPPGVPTLHRLSIGLAADVVTISFTTYMAVTSNTFQCGADLDVRASGGGFSLHGYLGFDALFVFHPFSFQTQMYAGVDILNGTSVLFQVSLDLNLSGPKPWAGQGTASFNIWFISISIGVSFTIGNAGAADPLPQIAVIPLLTTALSDIRNWSALLSSDLQRSVTLTTPVSNAQQVLVHPMGQLEVDERVVPLDFQISKFGNDAPSDGATFSISTVQFSPTGSSSVTAPDVTDAEDHFARGQFVNLSDADKLAAQSFELFHSGKVMGSTAVNPPSSRAQLTEAFTLYYVDDLELASTRITSNQYVRPLDLTVALLGQSASANVPARSKGNVKYLVPGATSPVSVSDAQYVVVNVADLTVNAAVASATGVTQAQANADLQAYIHANPGVAGTLEVVALYEAAA